MKKNTFFLFGLTCLSHMVLAETALDSITVTETPGNASQPTKTEQLNQGATNDTLGGYLDQLPNVDSASYGEAVGRPVVRGMNGYRLKILQNDNEVSDLSAMSQDHAVAVAPRAAERIELLKGPASLLYSAKAGGVIKISDALDAPFPEPGFSGELSGSLRDPQSHNLDARITVANEHLSLHAAGLQQKSDPYISGNGDTIKDSDVSTEQGQFGLGWKSGPRSEWQLNMTQLEKDYGIPNVTPDATRINMAREDLGVKFKYQPAQNWLETITVDALSSDYLHDETEGGRKDGLFGQKQQRGSVNLTWSAGEWLGESRLSVAQSELRVCHEHGACDDFHDASRTGNPFGESIALYQQNTGLPYSHGHPMPDTETQIVQAATVGYLMLDDVHELSLGANLQSRQLSANPDNIQEQWVYPAALDPNYYDQQDDHAISLSLGILREAEEKLPGWEASLSYMERLPSVDELFWNGFHHATDNYIFGDSNLNKERSLNLDIDLNYAWSRHRVQFSTFYYHFKDYIYQNQGFAEDGTELIDPFHLSEVWFTRQTDANFFGGSVRYENDFDAFNIKPITMWLQADALTATRSNGDHLPRTAPASAEIGIQHESNNWQGNLSLKHVFKARNLAPQEQGTPGYEWLSVYLQKNWLVSEQEIELWFKGENLTDTFAKNHLSVLKETAPLPGRQLSLGVNWRF